MDSPKARAGASSKFPFGLIRPTTQLTEKLGAIARVEIQALQLSRILAVVVDVALFLPSLSVQGSAPPHLFSTASRCFCVASANFCRPKNACVTCIDLPCRWRAYAGPSPLDLARSALGRVCFDLIGGAPISCALERGQPRQMTGTWSAAWEGVQWWCGEHSLAVFGS
jgi:hypothetical protein